MLKNWYKHKELILNFILTELKLKYRGSILGFIWTFLDPLFMILVLLLVFTKLFGYNLPYYPSFLLIGIFVWTYFQETTIQGLRVFKEYADIITKTPVPKEVLIIIKNLVQLVDFLLKFLILIISLFFLKELLNWPSLVNLNLNFLFLIFLISLQFLFILGITFFLSSVYIWFRDISNIWGILTHIGFFITPIFYPRELIPSKYSFIFSLNPMYYFIETYRNIIIHGTLPHMKNLLIIVGFTTVTLFIGGFIFNKLKGYIAEKV